MMTKRYMTEDEVIDVCAALQEKLRAVLDEMGVDARVGVLIAARLAPESVDTVEVGHVARFDGAHPALRLAMLDAAVQLEVARERPCVDPTCAVHGNGDRNDLH